MPKVNQNTFGGWALPGPAGGAYALLRPPSHNGGLFLRWTGEREGRERGKGIPPKVKLSRINTGC